MQLYADPITINCRKVMAGLKLMGIDDTLSKVDYFQAEQTSNAALPAMRDGDLTLWESNSILAYAADRHGKAAFYPTDPVARADVNRWLFWESAHWFPACYTYLVENCVKPLLGGAADPAVLAVAEPVFHKYAAILDQRLAKQPWLCGNTPTIADIAIAAPMHLHGWQQLPLDSHRPLRAWMTELVEQLPAWRNTAVFEGFTTERKAAAERT